MQERPRFFEDISRIFNAAADEAKTLGKEVETLVRTQVERLLSTMDVVTREEFEAVREMAVNARNANDALERRIKELEAQLAAPATPEEPKA